MARLRTAGGRLRVALKAIAPSAPSSFPAFGLVARWRADAGITESSGSVSEWTDSVKSIELTPVSGSPELVTLHSGAEGVRFTNGDNAMTGSVGDLPVGAEDRTILLAIKPSAGVYAGLGWGANANYQSCMLGVDPDCSPIFDFRGDRLVGPTPIQDRMSVLIGTYDGATAGLHVDGVLVGTRAVSLNTGSTQINLMRAWSGNTQDGEVGEMAVWDRVLTPAEIAAVTSYALARYAVDATAPTLSGALIPSTGQTSASVQVMIDEPGTLWWAITTSATPLSVANLKAGTGADDFGTLPAIGAGTYTDTAAGLTEDTTYYVQWHAEDLAGNASGVVVSAGVDTLAEESIPPIATISSVAPTTSGGVATWTTDVPSGTLYWLVSANASETVATIKAGAGLASSNFAVTASGSQTFTFGGLSGGTPYYLHIMHRSLLGSDSVPDAEGFTTTSIVSTTFDATVATAAELVSTLQGMETSGISSQKVIGVTANITGTVNITDIDLPHLVTIRPSGGTYTGDGTNDTVACNRKFTSPINISGSSNIRFLLSHVSGGTVSITNSQDITFEASLIEGDPPANPAANSPTQNDCFVIKDTVRVTLLDCAMRNSLRSFIYFQGANAFFNLENSIFHIALHDVIKMVMTGTMSDSNFLNSWGNRWWIDENVGAPGAHEDSLQIQAGAQLRVTWRGWVELLYKPWWHLNAGGDHQCLFMIPANGIVPLDTMLVDQCIFLSNTDAAIKTSSTANTQANCLTRDTTLQSVGAGATMRNSFPGLRNFTTSHNTGDQGAGTNGLTVNISSTSAPNYAGLAIYYENGIPGQNSAGVPPSSPYYIDAMKPKAGTRTHWAYPGVTAGAATRLREIFDPAYRDSLPTKVLPWRWPALPVFKRTYDANHGALPALGGSYTSEGVPT